MHFLIKVQHNVIPRGRMALMGGWVGVRCSVRVHPTSRNCFGVVGASPGAGLWCGEQWMKSGTGTGTGQGMVGNGGTSQGTTGLAAPHADFFE